MSLPLPLKIDLHMHSNISDGTDMPEELLSRVKSAGISIFSLTDHDEISGCERIRKILTQDDPVFINGVEFSCMDEEGKYHILGYGYNIQSSSIKEIVQAGHQNRIEWAKYRMYCLKRDFGFCFSEEDEASYLSLNSPGQSHLGDLMVKYGYADNKRQAIGEYISKIHLPPHLFLRPENAISGIIASGGIPILAHPLFGSGSQHLQEEDIDKRLKKLTELGLKGIEAYYSKFSSDQIDLLLKYAEKYNILVTAGSDYHGANKSITIGATGLVDTLNTSTKLLNFLNTFLKI